MIERIAINGVISKPEDAKISVFDRGFLYGDAVYEVTRSYGKVLFLLEDHLDRLQRSADQIGLELGKSREQWMHEIYGIHAACEGENAYVRLQISRGEGQIGLDPTLAPSPNVVVFVRPVSVNKPEFYSHGCSIMTTPVMRNKKGAIDPNIKSGNYLNNILAIRYGVGHAVQECLMLNDEGNLTEGTTSNLFIVKDGVVRTPSDQHDILYGITRNKVRELCKRFNLPLENGTVSVPELLDADEVFLSSSVREVMPVALVNGQKVKHSPGPVTQMLYRGYQDLISEYIQWATQHHPWQNR